MPWKRAGGACGSNLKYLMGGHRLSRRKPHPPRFIDILPGIPPTCHGRGGHSGDAPTLIKPGFPADPAHDGFSASFRPKARPNLSPCRRPSWPRRPPPLRRRHATSILARHAPHPRPGPADLVSGKGACSPTVLGPQGDRQGREWGGNRAWERKTGPCSWRCRSPHHHHRQPGGRRHNRERGRSTGNGITRPGARKGASGQGDGRESLGGRASPRGARKQAGKAREDGFGPCAALSCFLAPRRMRDGDVSSPCRRAPASARCGRGRRWGSWRFWNSAYRALWAAMTRSGSMPVEVLKS